MHSCFWLLLLISVSLQLRCGDGMEQRPPQGNEKQAGEKPLKDDDEMKMATDKGKNKKEQLGDRPAKKDLTKENMEMLKTDPDFMAHLDLGVFKESLQQFNDIKGNTQELAAINRKLLKVDEVGHPKHMKKGTLKQMGPLAKMLPPDVFEDVNPVELKGAMASIKHARVSRFIARKAVKTLRKGRQLELSTAEDLQNLGQFVKGLDISDLDQLPDEAMRAAKDDLAKIDFNPAQTTKILEKCEGAGVTLGKAMGKLLRFVSPVNITSAPDWRQNFGLDNNTETEPTKLQLTHAQAAVVIEKIIAGQGGNLAEVAPPYIKRLRPVVAKGISVADIRSMVAMDALTSMGIMNAETNPILAIMEMLEPHAGQMSAAQLEELAHKITSDVADLADLPEENLKKMLTIISFADDKQLESLSPRLKSRVSEAALRLNCHHHTKSRVKKFTQLYLQNLHGDDGSDSYVNKTTADTITASDMAKLRQSLGGFKPEQAVRLSVEAAKLLVSGARHACSYPSNIMEIAMDQVMEDEKQLRTAKGILEVCEGLHVLSREQLQEIPMEAAAEASLGVLGCLAARKRTLNYRKRMGFLDIELKQRDLNLQQQLKNVIHHFTSAFQSTGETDESREENTLDCPTVLAMGEGALTLDANEILSIKDFSNCAEAVGAMGGWSNAQKKALLKKAKEAWGTGLTDWPAENVAAAGSMLSAASPQTFASVVQSVDMLSVLGKYDDLGQGMLSAGFQKWLDLTYEGDFSRVTPNDLVAMGAFVCGLTASQIEQLPPSIYRVVAFSIGKYRKSCGQEKSEEYIKLATGPGGFGEVEEWSAADIKEIGVVITGLCHSTMPGLDVVNFDYVQTCLYRLNYNQIRSIDCDIIPRFSPACFGTFTATQLRAFSSSQAATVTRAQAGALTDEQREALQQAGQGILHPQPAEVGPGLTRRKGPLNLEVSGSVGFAPGLFVILTVPLTMLRHLMSN